MTLRTRLALALVAAVVFGAGVFGVAARATVQNLLYSDIDRELRTEVGRTVENLRNGGAPFQGDVGPAGRGPRTPRAGEPAAMFGRRALFAQVLDSDGHVLLRTTAVEAIGGLPAPDLDDDDDDDDDDDGRGGEAAPGRGGARVHFRVERLDDERFRIAEALGPEGVTVQVASPMGEVSRFLDALLWVLVAAGSVALAAAVLLGRWAARSTLRPVEQMTRTARRIAGSPRDLSARVAPAFPDHELAEFAESMNEMLRSIEESDQRQRRFVADASHELRTPLTSLGGNATYLERTSQLDEDGRDALAAVHRDIDRLTRIADGLTTLARLDAAPGSQLEPVDLVDVAREVVTRARTSYPDHTFELDGRAEVQLLDVELVRRIVGNLVDNAGRYSPAGSRVEVSIARDEAGDALELVVADDGPGIPPDEIDHARERFGRASTSTGVSGTGLGLAIVDEAARALGGSLRLEQHDPHGLRCVVRLPASTAG